MKATPKRRKAVSSERTAIPPTTRKPTKLKYSSITVEFVKALRQICDRLKLAEDQLFARYQVDGDLTAAQLWLEAQNQWRIAEGLLQRLTAPASVEAEAP